MQNWSLHDHIEVRCNGCDSVVVSMFLPRAWTYDVEERCPFCGCKKIKQERITADEMMRRAEEADRQQRAVSLVSSGVEKHEDGAVVLKFKKKED